VPSAGGCVGTGVAGGVYSASVQEQDGAKRMFERIQGRHPRLRLVWVRTSCAWVVERTFGWLSHYRVLSKDYEVLPLNSEAVVYVAMIHLMRYGD
jgi:transposase